MKARLNSGRQSVEDDLIGVDENPAMKKRAS